MDAIRLTGMSFYGYHGVEPEERRLGQRFVVDLGLELDLRPAGQRDDLNETVNYAEVWRAVRVVVEGPPVRLIERLGELVAARVLADFPSIRAVRVRVEKPWVPIAGAQLANVAVELCRSRDDSAGTPTETA